MVLDMDGRSIGGRAPLLRCGIASDLVGINYRDRRHDCILRGESNVRVAIETINGEAC